MRKQSLILCTVVLVCGILGAVLGQGEREAQSVLAGEGIELPIAMYHSVTDEGKSPGEYVISRKRLEQDLQYLQQAGWETVTVQQVVDYVENGAPLPEHPVMLTFDDGYYNNYANAYPLLERYGMKGVLSPIGTLTEQFTQAQEAPHEVWSYCTEQQLVEMAQSGVIEMQNHSFDFHELSPRRGCLRKQGEDQAAYENIFRTDTQRAQEVFAKLGIDEPICYTYPYGACNAETDALVEQCGFVSSLSCEEGINRLTHDPRCLYKLKRWNRDGRQSTEQFWSTVRREMQ